MPYTPIEDADISKQTNRFTSDTMYDDAGNVIHDDKFRGQDFWYDANGRMIKTANTNNINESNAVYDASGNRVGTQVDDVWTFFVYDARGKKVAEYGGLQATDEGGVKYVLQDHQGSSRAILNSSGYVQARMDYTAFGEEINAGVGQRTTAQGFGANETLNQKYALTERDEATGLDHTWFRKHENRAGRWTSPDPYNGSMSLGNPQSFNRYSYVENQPTNFVDPSGLQLSANEACSYSGGRDSDGNLIYDGRIDSSGRCQSTAGSVQVYWTGGVFSTPRVNPSTLPNRDIGGGGGGGSNNTRLLQSPITERNPKIQRCLGDAVNRLKDYIEKYAVDVNLNNLTTDDLTSQAGSMLFTVVGAVVGAAIGGPVGAVKGAIVGAITGYFVGLISLWASRIIVGLIYNTIIAAPALARLGISAAYCYVKYGHEGF